MVFRVGGYSGLDVWRYIMSPKWQARSVAKQLLKKVWKGANPAETEMIVELPVGNFKLVNDKGDVEPCERKMV